MSNPYQSPDQSAEPAKKPRKKRGMMDVITGQKLLIYSIIAYLCSIPFLAGSNAFLGWDDRSSGGHSSVRSRAVAWVSYPISFSNCRCGWHLKNGCRAFPFIAISVRDWRADSCSTDWLDCDVHCQCECDHLSERPRRDGWLFWSKTLTGV